MTPPSSDLREALAESRQALLDTATIGGKLTVLLWMVGFAITLSAGTLSWLVARTDALSERVAVCCPK